MRTCLAVSLMASVAAVAPSAHGAAHELPGLRLAPAFPELTFDRPVDMAFAGDGSGRAFVVEQAGVIRQIDAGKPAARSRVVLDIRSKVRTWHNEEGLLALALHPGFGKNGQLFVFYSLLEEGRLARLVGGRPRVNVLARYTMAPGADRIDPASEKVLLRVEKRHGNHNGAAIVFGPDGYLYLSLGDGGAAGDPDNNGQSLATLLGKILRIDVDRAEGGRAYAIPPDNPFVDRSGARPEIWAYGLRNVWRMSFDRKTGELWAADVGQNRWEEIDVIVKGGNYGWRLREGKHDFKSDGKAQDRLIEPVAEYGREVGACVTGGHVYRGRRFPRLAGIYLFADYVTGTFLTLRRDGADVAGPVVVLEQPKNIASIAADPEGELYALAFDGRIYRIEEAESGGAPGRP